MFKKLFIGLTPLLAIAALAVMPVVAQAAIQHWYVNGVKATEGEQIPVVWFGNEVNLNQTSPGFGEVNCRTVGGGTIENPVGGGAGVGSMNAVSFYECKGAQCEEKILKQFAAAGREWVEAKTCRRPSTATRNGDPFRGPCCSKKALSRGLPPSG
jgi:hypothetical protein